MSRNPYPTLEQVTRVVPPRDVLRMDLDDPKVWTRPSIVDYRFLCVHWGGGPNQAGNLIEEPAMSLAQKISVTFGRVKEVARSWEAYHISKGMSAIAYCTAIPLYGGILRWRGHRHNGGQWGSINSFTHAAVFVLGFGQHPTRWAWRSLGLLWFCSGGPQVVGHRYFNAWPQTQSKTSCPGDPISEDINQERYVRALGTLRFGVPLMRGQQVRALTVKLAGLGYLPGMRSRYGRQVRAAVGEFQKAHKVDSRPGVVGPATWKALAQA